QRARIRRYREVAARGCLGHDAVVGNVAELFLHRVGDAVPTRDRALLGVADVTDLPVGLVVPRERWRVDRGETDLAVGDGLDHLVGGDRGGVLEVGSIAAPGLTGQVGMHAVVQLGEASASGDGAV